MTEQEKETVQSEKAGSERDEELANAVDSLEDRIVEERKAEDQPGNESDRAATNQVESEDQAPE